ncbi:hypothetical protein PE066_05500 [Ramlibacter tataouinensis]|uniref:hypothetical protein n=1 Tax=Ramlibacter tataouinensis TaxID=94132 RepID=UPI0022F407F1|nr:hypothetical protein [Ramlibacter tataouinensis]WBY02991.1 hypothetical protein PE066_05500 [Ramlibacter tataouinensis]
MSGIASIRVAAFVALGYSMWVLAGGAVQIGAAAQAMTLRLSVAQPVTWLVGLLALVVAWGLWMRYAWAWWLGLAAALFQAWRMAWPLFAGAGAPRLPGMTTLLVLALLLVFVVLLFMPKARAACNR